MQYQTLDDRIKTKSHQLLIELNSFYDEKLKEFSSETDVSPQELGGKISGLGKTILTKYKIEMITPLLKNFISFDKEVFITQSLYSYITKDIFGKSLSTTYHQQLQNRDNKYSKHTKHTKEIYFQWKNKNKEIIEEIFGRTPTEEELEKIKKEKKIFLRVGGKLQEFDLKITIRRQKELEKLKERTKEQMKTVIGTIAI